MDHRLKDHRGNHKERERNGGERFERRENPQADFPPGNDGPDKGNPDEPNSENFNGQNLHVTPFAPDIAPPSLLIPVPGAGYNDLDAPEDEVTVIDYRSL